MRIIKYEDIFSKGCTGNWAREIFIIDSVLKINTSSYKIKHLIEKK